jgi:hypothetical protein
MAAMALDVPERQVLVPDWGEPGGYIWQHRVLVVPSGVNDGRWVAITPDLELQVVDLGSFSKFVPLSRSGRIPAAYAPICYTFDADIDLDASIREAKAYADAMGFGKGVGHGGRDTEGWLIADVGHPEFGEEVPEEALRSDAQALLRSKTGLVCLDAEGGDEWVYIEKVGRDEASKRRWRAAKESSCDRRVLKPTFDQQNRRFLGEAEAVGAWANDPSAYEDWPLLGPRATLV